MSPSPKPAKPPRRGRCLVRLDLHGENGDLCVLTGVSAPEVIVKGGRWYRLVELLAGNTAVYREESKMKGKPAR